MSLSRRRFTQEFKLSAVERLDQGASAAEVSRAYEINPNLLHRWRREFRQGPANAFPGEGKRRWEETRTAELERKVGQQTMGSIFLRGACSASNNSGSCRHRLESRCQPPDPATSPGETADERPTDVPAGEPAARFLLPLAA